MSRLAKFIFCIMIIFILFSTVSIADDLESEFETENEDINLNISNDNDLHILSRRATVYERNSKTFLYDKNSDEQCPMASTTKIMTCILILENCELEDTVVISNNSAHTGGSRLGLAENNSVTVRDLLYGLMLCSGNDDSVS